MVGIAAELPHLLELGQNMLLSSLGIADSPRLLETLQKTRQGADVPIVPLMRTLVIELWLKDLTTRHVLANAAWKTRAATKQGLPQTDDVSPIASNVSRLQ
jgi:aryl carrier-like protein